MLFFFLQENLRGEATTILKKCNFCILHPISFILIPNESPLQELCFIVSIDPPYMAGVRADNWLPHFDMKPKMCLW